MIGNASQIQAWLTSWAMDHDINKSPNNVMLNPGDYKELLESMYTDRRWGNSTGCQDLNYMFWGTRFRVIPHPIIKTGTIGLWPKEWLEK
jgi:hypothetical protein